MPSPLTSGHIGHLLADCWLFEHRGRAVEASLSFDEPERVLLVGLGGAHVTEIEWDVLADLLHADEHRSDVQDHAALAVALGRIIDDPTAHGARRLDHD